MAAKLFDNIESLFATLVISLIFLQIAAMVAFQLFGVGGSLRLGGVFILIAVVIIVIMAYMVVVNRQLVLDNRNYPGIIIVIVLMLGTIFYLPRLLPQIFDQTTLDNLHKTGLFATAGAPIQVPGQLQTIIDVFGSVVSILTPFLTMVLLLIAAFFIHFKVKKTSKYKTALLGLTLLVYILVSLTSTYVQSFGGA